MHLGFVLALVVVFGGFIAAGGFRLKRQRRADDERLAQKDLASRRHHFRGNPDVELVQRPPEDDQR